MFKRISSLLIAVILLSGMILVVSAQTVSFIADGAGLFYSGELAELEEKAASLTSDFGIDVVIVTADSLNGINAQDYADNYYDSHGYSDNGVLFLLAMEEREWYISTSGSMIYTLTDYGIQQLGEAILPYLSSGYWYEGFAHYLEILPQYLTAYESGPAVDGYADYSGNYYHGQQDEIIYNSQKSKPNFILSLIIGLATGGITILIMRAAMNTKRHQHGASDYLKDGSWNLHTHRDIYLYSNVSKTRRQQNTAARSGGGSSVHRSSGGRSHGGGGGRF